MFLPRQYKAINCKTDIRGQSQEEPLFTEDPKSFVPLSKLDGNLLGFTLLECRVVNVGEMRDIERCPDDDISGLSQTNVQNKEWGFLHLIKISKCHRTHHQSEAHYVARVFLLYQLN